MMACQITEEQHNYTLLIDYINRLLMKKKTQWILAFYTNQYLLSFLKFCILLCSVKKTEVFVLFCFNQGPYRCSQIPSVFPLVIQMLLFSMCVMGERVKTQKRQSKGDQLRAKRQYIPKFLANVSYKRKLIEKKKIWE